MNPDRERPSAAGEPRQRDDSRRTTPAADMQPEDAGTEESGTEDHARADTRDSGGGTPADKAMKQQQKTDAGR
jgi:hypothetical protein